MATEEPQMAAKPPQAATVAMPSPPRRWPTKAIGGAKQLAAHARVGDKRAHQQEHRDDAEGVVGDRAHRRLADQLERRRTAIQVSEARHADEAHRHADRHAQQHQHEQRDETDDGDGIGAHACHSTGLISFCTAGSTM